MSILETIKTHKITAMKNKEGAKSTFLAFIQGEFERVDKNIEDNKAIDVLKKIEKGLKDTLSNLDPNDDKTLECHHQLEILQQYIPQQLSEEEMMHLIRTNFRGKMDAGVGNIMAFFKKEYAGRYDGKLLSTLAKEYLGVI